MNFDAETLEPVEISDDRGWIDAGITGVGGEVPGNSASGSSSAAAPEDDADDDHDHDDDSDDSSGSGSGGDVVFPLGVWAEGEVRQFEATEFTLFGPARRLITLEILDLDHVYEGVAHSLSYRLTIRDEPGRVLNCEISVYSPGRGLVAFEASNYWQGASDGDACSFPG